MNKILFSNETDDWETPKEDIIGIPIAIQSLMSLIVLYSIMIPNTKYQEKLNKEKLKNYELKNKRLEQKINYYERKEK